MQRPPSIPKRPGVYALVSLVTTTGQPDGSRVAYVGWCSNLQQRANMWEYHFRKREKDPEHTLPAKGLPALPSGSWAFLVWPDKDKNAGIVEIRSLLQERNFQLVNSKTRVREQITYKGKTATIAEHARDAGVAYTKAYWRWRANKPLDEVFAA